MDAESGYSSDDAGPPSPVQSRLTALSRARARLGVLSTPASGSGKPPSRPFGRPQSHAHAVAAAALGESTLMRGSSSQLVGSPDGSPDGRRNGKPRSLTNVTAVAQVSRSLKKTGLGGAGSAAAGAGTIKKPSARATLSSDAALASLACHTADGLRVELMPRFHVSAEGSEP